MTELISNVPIPEVTKSVTFTVSPEEGAITFVVGADVYVSDAQSVGINTDLTFTAVTDVPDPVRYEWDFGDGAKRSGEEIIHSFKIPNPHQQVTLQVTDSAGQRYTVSKQIYLEDRTGSSTVTRFASPVSPPVFRSVSSGTSFSDLSESLTHPAGVSNGDEEVIVLVARDTANRIWIEGDEWETIFTKISTLDVTMIVARHRYSSGDSPVKIVSETYTPTPFCWAIHAFRGVSATRQYESRSCSNLIGTSPSFNLTSLDIDRLALTWMIRESPTGSATNPGGSTEHVDITSGSLALATATTSVPTATTTGFDWNGTADNQFCGGILLVPHGLEHDVVHFSDDSSVANEDTVWGQTITNAGCFTQSGSGGPHGGAHRISTLDPGDPEHRAEAAYNEWRFGEGGWYEPGTDSGTAVICQQGQKMRVTQYVKLVTGFDLTSGIGYQAINQFKDAEPEETTGTGGFDLEVRSNAFHLKYEPGNGGASVSCGTVACAANTAYKIVYEVKWSKNSDGFFKWYVDDVLINSYTGSTLTTNDNGNETTGYYPTGTALRSHWRIGQYRNADVASTQSIQFEDMLVELIP